MNPGIERLHQPQDFTWRNRFPFSLHMQADVKSWASDSAGTEEKSLYHPVNRRRRRKKEEWEKGIFASEFMKLGNEAGAGVR